VSEQRQRLTSEARWEAELERNVYLLRHLANMYHCFGMSNHANTINRTVRKVERRIQDMRIESDSEKAK
jgi:hypothetical protein